MTQIELDFRTYKAFTDCGMRRELDLDEFKCPETDEVVGNTTVYCEAKGLNRGCRDLKVCKAYNDQKALEARYGDLNRRLPEPDRSRIEMIKKGIIHEKLL